MENMMSASAMMITSMLLSSTIGAAVKIAALSPTATVFFRCAIGCAGLLGVIRWTRIPFRSVDIRRQLGLILTSGACLLINWTLLFASYEYTSIGVSTAAYHVYPLIVLTLGYLFFNERVDSRFWPLLGVGGVGLLVLLGSQLQFNAQSAAGVYLASAAGACYALCILFTRRISFLPPSVIAACHTALGAAAFFLPAELFSLTVSIKTISAVLFLGLVCTTLMFSLLYGALKTLPIGVSSALAFIYPIAAFAVDLMVFGKRPTLTETVGAATIIGAAYVALRIKSAVEMD